MGMAHCQAITGIYSTVVSPTFQGISQRDCSRDIVGVLKELHILITFVSDFAIRGLEIQPKEEIGISIHCESWCFPMYLGLYQFLHLYNYMKITFWAVAMLLVSCYSIQAQSIHRLQIGLSGIANAFQDQKYSDSHFGGFGGGLNLSYELQNPSFIVKSSLQGSFGNDQSATHSNGSTSVTNIRIQGQYLHKLKDQFHLGLRWDIFDLYLRSTAALQNNSSYFLSSSTWYLSGQYALNVFKDKKLTIGADLGVATFFKESTGFAFSTSQSVLEDGGFNYQDESILGPFGLKHFIVHPFWKQLNFRTHFNLDLNRRWSVGYHWYLRRFSSVKSYPTTLAQHRLGVNFLLFERPRKKASNSNH